MKRVGFRLKVKEKRLEDYKAHHREVWAEMLTALTESGWHNYSLFLAPDGTLFGYFETPESLAAALAAMNHREINERWQAQMAPFFESPDGGRADEMIMELEEVFHLD